MVIDKNSAKQARSNPKYISILIAQYLQYLTLASGSILSLEYLQESCRVCALPSGFSSTRMSGRQSFLNQAAPENYVAGLGRGATGFTTRSDLGPARSGPSEDQIKDALAKRAAQLGAAPPTAYGATEKKEENDEDDDRFQDPENEVGLFANGAYDRDDDEADRIYQEVDEKMEKRRKHRRLVAYLSKDPISPTLKAYGLSYFLV